MISVEDKLTSVERLVKKLGISFHAARKLRLAGKA